MSNFLKIGNSQQNFETEKAIGKSGDFDLNAGEVVEVTFDNTEATGSHRISDPVGAIPIDCPVSPVTAIITWTFGPNTVTATSHVATTGTMKFLVF